MVLAKALVDKEKDMGTKYDPEKGHVLPQMPLHEARQVMTRADFIQSYDSINVFTIDSKAMVRVRFTELCKVYSLVLTIGPGRFCTYDERLPRNLRD